ncbi:MAG: hypothetical protein BZY79_00085 [SAR202 cluster bacterium Casp-Chloro-G4]|nr:hypothetical protein [Chloroflexota bacterium]MDA1227410.1 hypothetical protein [Chloroflexota bacterium]PKB62146.1 MAG: hypothetical protein BZY79_00085 [SAR202 cluster bacterium Casp-Chloro-G4]
MDNDFVFDLDEIMSSINTAEVMSIFFPTFRKSVVIDTRSNVDARPMVKIMPMVASPQERLRSIRRLRPGFPRVHNLTVVPWPRYVDSLVNLGLWERIVRRFQDSGDTEMVRQCENVLSDLIRMEKEEMAAVIRGENYQTIWSARGE